MFLLYAVGGGGYAVGVARNLLVHDVVQILHAAEMAAWSILVPRVVF